MMPMSSASGAECLTCLVQLSPIIDRTVLKTVKAAFGGRVRFVVSGGAPLGPSVEAFLNITLCCPVLQVCSVSTAFHTGFSHSVCAVPVSQEFSALQHGNHSLNLAIIACLSQHLGQRLRQHLSQPCLALIRRKGEMCITPFKIAGEGGKQLCMRISGQAPISTPHNRQLVEPQYAQGKSPWNIIASCSANLAPAMRCYHDFCCYRYCF